MSQVAVRHRPGQEHARILRGSAAWLLAAALLLALLVAAGAVLLSGAAAAGDLVDPGALVRWGLPLVDAVVHLAAMVTLGGLTLCAVVLRPGTPPWHRAATLSAIAAIAWTVAQAVHLILVHASVMGSGLSGPGYPALVVQFISGLDLGATLAWAVVLSAVTAALAVLSTTSASACWAAVAAGVALLPRAGLGHASGAGNHELAVSAMWLHLLGTGLWAGTLAVLVFSTLGLKADLASTVSRFSAIAGWAVAMVVVSGAASAWIRLDSPWQLLTTAWGQLLTVKIVAFTALAAAGWHHRRSTIPLLTDAGGRSWPFWRLAAVEVLTMSAVVGVSVALGSSAPPIPQARTAEGAELAGLPAPWFTGLVTQWSLDPLFVFLAGAGAWVYVSWALRLRRRGDAWPAARMVCWLLGMALLVWTTSGGVGVYGRVLFSVHMIQHMMLLSVLPVFIVLGSPVTLALRALPRRQGGTRGPRELLLAALHARWARFFAHPVVAALHVPVSMAVFYLTPLFELALRSHVLHVLMMVHFFLVGYLFTNVVIGTDPGPQRPFFPLRLVLLLPSMVFHTFFGLFLLSSTSPLAGAFFTGMEPPWTDPVTDQQVGGAVSWAMGEVPALALAMIVATRWTMHDERAQRRRERAGRPHRPDPAVPSPAND